MFCVLASGFPEIAAHAPWLPPGRVGTFDEVVDGAGCSLVVMDHHRVIATGWPVAQLANLHWDGSLLTEGGIGCFLSRDVSQTSTQQCGLMVYGKKKKKSVCVFREKEKSGLDCLHAVINLKC